MLRRFVTAAIAAAVLALIPYPAAAQSLGEVAAREKAKKKPAQPAKVLTEEDARRAKGVVVIAPAPAGEEGAKPATEAAKPEGAVATPATPAKPEPTEEEKLAAEQKEWREKLQTARDEVARLKTQVDQIQNSLNDPNMGFYNQARTTLTAKIDEVKKQLATAELAVSDLEDTGRRRAWRQ